MKKEIVVLLSGGVDSTTCLAKAIKEYGNKNVLALGLYYGQKHSKEIEKAQQVADYYEVDFIVQKISGVFDYSECTLLQGRGDIAHKSYEEQQAEVPGTVATYVPFRNGLFLSYATAIAISVGANHLYYGAHMDDATGGAYPDCTEEFVWAMSSAIHKGSGKQLCMEAPLLHLNKTQVVEMGLRLGAPYHLTWSCYEGGDTPCGKCGTCLDRQKAFENNGIADPALIIKGE